MTYTTLNVHKYNSENLYDFITTITWCQFDESLVGTKVRHTLKDHVSTITRLSDNTVLFRHTFGLPPRPNMENVENE